MKTSTEITSILRQCSFPGYTFVLLTLYGNPSAFYLQARFKAPNAITGDVEDQATRKWLLSPHMTRSEIVQTALKCVLSSVEHEARETFKYRDHAIFGPHFSVDALVDLRRAEFLDVRP